MSKVYIPLIKPNKNGSVVDYSNINIQTDIRGLIKIEDS